MNIKLALLVMGYGLFFYGFIADEWRGAAVGLLLINLGI